MPGQSTDHNRNQEAIPYLGPSRRRVEVPPATPQDSGALQRADASVDRTPLPPVRAPSELALLGMRLIPDPLRDMVWRVLGFPPAAREAFGDALAQRQPFYALRVLSVLSLPHEEQRARIALLLTRWIPEEVVRDVARLRIEDPKIVFEIALAAVSVPVSPIFFPKWRSRTNVPGAISRLPLSDEDKARLFAHALRSRPPEAAEILRASRITSSEGRRIAARAVVNQGDLASLIQRESPVTVTLTPEWIANVADRRANAERAAERAPSRLIQILKLAHLTESDDRLRVVMAAAQSGRDFPFASLRALGIYDEATVVSIFDAVASKNAVCAVGALAWRPELSQSSRLRVIESALTSDERLLEPRLLLDALASNEQLDSAEKRRFGMMLARKAGWALSMGALERLGIATKEDRLAYACEVARFGPPPSSGLLHSKLDISSRQDVKRIFLAAVHSEATDAIGTLAGDFPVLTSEDRIEIFRAAVSARVDGVGAVSWIAADLSNLELNRDVIAAEIQIHQERFLATGDLSAVRRIACVLRGMLANPSPRFLEIDGPLSALDEVDRGLARLEDASPDLRTKRSVLAQIAEPLSLEAASIVGASVVALAHEEEFGVTAEQCVAAIFGLHGLQGANLSPRNFRALVEVLGSVYGPTSREVPPLGELLSISEEVWRTDFQGALECIVGLAALHSFNREPSIPFREVLLCSLDAVRKEISSELGSALHAALGISGKGGALELVRQWGDVTPVAILLGRFQRCAQREIPTLSGVVERIISGTFLDNRYDPGNDQFAGFADATIARWRENPHRLALARSGLSTQVSRDYKRSFAQALHAQLLTHVGSEYLVLSHYHSLTVSEVLELATLSQSEFSRHYRALDPDGMGKALPHIAACIGVLLRADCLEDARSFLRNVSTIKSRIGLNLVEAHRQLILGDMHALSEALKERSVERGRGYLIFTTITDDPKLLLMSGDLVPTASCHNYRTGSHIQTLLSYVVDGNIKASLSFVVAESLVRSLFGVPAKAELDVNSFKLSFNHPRLELTLISAEGVSQIIPLGKAIRRRILRAGQRLSDGAPCVYAERPYELLHAVSGSIVAEEEILFRDLEERCGFKPAVGSVEFPATLNPLGAYTDYAQAVMVGSYTLHFDAESVVREARG